MNAGELDNRIEIQQLTESRDSFGQPIKSWSLLAAVWSKFIPATSSESVTAEQRSSVNQAMFEIRYRRGITPRMRVKHDGAYWEIEGVHEPERRVKLVLQCHAFEVQSGG